MDVNQNNTKVENLITQQNATEEEFENFIQQVTQVEKIIKKLSSSDTNEQEEGQLLANKILKQNTNCKNICENTELRVKHSRTVINKHLNGQTYKNPNELSKEAFMKSIGIDAIQRAEDRQRRNEHAETFKKIGNTAFKDGNFEMAITYFTKGIEQRKDSTVLWNNRALSFMKLKLYQKALEDFEWALKVNESNLKALLNSAKCHKLLKNVEKYQEFMKRAEESNPQHIIYIKEFNNVLCTDSIN